MNLENYTYKNLMQTALAQVPNTVDKKEGSIIYDALAPACYVLSQMYLDLNEILKAQFVETSYGEYLDKLSTQFGVYRLEATKAVKKGVFKDSSNNSFNINIGDRFSTVGNDALTYIAIEKVSDGIFKLECEEAGSKGNSYTGNIIPITFINGLATATMEESLVLGRDIETDEALKERYISQMNQKAFGGNIADYVEKAKEISGVGAVQIYPIWNGGGTVKLSIVDTDYNPLSNAVVDSIQEAFDPTSDSGEGYGIAPIGHTVTVTTPTELTLNISADINTETGTTIEQVQDDVEENIGKYIDGIRENFGTSVNKSYTQTIYVAQILSAIINTDGVENVTNVTINGSSSDITLVETGVTQQLAKLGTVTLNEAS